MTGLPAPIDPRQGPDFLRHLLDRLPGYLSDALPEPQSPGWALLAIGGRYLEAVAQRLNQAPEKHKLAFLDGLGVSLLPAQSARLPVVFELDPSASGGIAPQGTQVAAPPPAGSSKPVVFETERAASVSAGKLAQVVSLWPGRDEYIDHSAAVAAGEPVRAFDRLLLEPTPHVLYIAHDHLLALSGNVRLSVELSLTQGSSAPLDVRWEYWDGEVWRGFLDSSRECLVADSARLDGTLGLTESGSYTLIADGAESVRTSVDGSDHFWLRGRLAQPLPANPQQVLPQVESIRIGSTQSRVLRGQLKVSVVKVLSLFEAKLMRSAHLVSPLGSTSARVISGKVLNAAGDPVPNAEVTLLAGPDLNKAKTFKSLATGQDGSYALPAVALGSDDRLWFRVTWSGMSFDGPEGAVAVPELPAAPRHTIDLFIDVEGLLPDEAFADATSLDLTKPFYALGHVPAPGTTFYFASQELLSRPGAQASLYVAKTRSPQDLSQAGDASETELPHQTRWEYWNGRNWAVLAVSSRTSSEVPDLDRTEILDFVVPDDLGPTRVNDKEARWIRMRITSGGYGFVKLVTSQTGTSPSTLKFAVTRPPVLEAFRLGYTWQFGPQPPEQVLTYNDFAYQDHTYEAIWPGTVFLPYRRSNDELPALYLGFDKAPPVGQLGIYFAAQEATGQTRGPALAWEYWDGFAWRELSVDDETAALRRPGIAAVLTQADDTALVRFGKRLHWIRARLKHDEPPGQPVLTALRPNAVWASERQTLKDVSIGASSGLPRQTFAVTQLPVLAGEILEVRELVGARANVEWRLLAAALFVTAPDRIRELELELSRHPLDTPFVRGPLRLMRDRQGRVSEAWVRWSYRSEIVSARADERVYTLDRSAGRVYFGDGTAGKIPPRGAALVFRLVASGGGLSGNVPAQTVRQLLGVVPGVRAIDNARGGEGGANAETLALYRERAPRTLRHRGRAIVAADYEVMAREASTAVAFARALPARSPDGIARAGWVTLIIVPASDEARPQPSFGMCELVRRYIEARACADVAAARRIAVVGPSYDPVDVKLTLAPLHAAEAGMVEARVRRALQDFLHPVKGGPEASGWVLGRDVFLSDVAALIEAVDGVDHVAELALLRDGVETGECFDVRPESIAAHGKLTIRLELPEA